MFRREDNGWCVSSSWFIVSDKDNPILKLTRDLLFEYWKKYNFLIDYFAFHMMLKLSAQKYNYIWDEVPFISNQIPHQMQFKGLWDKYSDDLMKKFADMSDFHKLTYAGNRNLTDDTLFNYLISGRSKY